MPIEVKLLTSTSDRHVKDLPLGCYGIITRNPSNPTSVGKFVLKGPGGGLLLYNSEHGFSWASENADYYYRKLLPGESVVFSGE